MKVDTNAVSNPAVNIEKSPRPDRKNGVEIGAEQNNGPASERFSSVEISDNAKLMQRAMEVVKTTPDVREERVAALKQSIRAGRYQVDAGSLSDKIIDDHVNLHFGKNNL